MLLGESIPHAKHNHNAASRLATLKRLYTNVSLYCDNAGMPSDIRDPWWGVSPELLEQCEQAVATLAQVVPPRDQQIDRQ